MTSSTSRVSGILLILAGMLFGGFMFFHPANNPEGAVEAIWVPVHFAWFLAYLLIIAAFVSCHRLLADGGKAFGAISYWLAFLGTVLSLPIAVWDSFIVPYLANHAPDMILQIEEFSTETPVFVFRIIVFLTVFLFSLGFILYGIAIVQAQVAPLIAGVCLALGAPLFWMGALFVSKGPLGNQVTEIGAVLFGLGLVMLGRRVLANTDTHGWLQSEAEAT